MEAPNKLPQMYGYAVCLVALIFALGNISDVIGGITSLVTPERSFVQYQFRSFDNYLAVRENRQRAAQQGLAMAPDTASRATLQARYASDRAEAFADAKYQAVRSLVRDGAVFSLAVVLFLVHWVWVRRLSRRAAA